MPPTCLLHASMFYVQAQLRLADQTQQTSISDIGADANAMSHEDVIANSTLQWVVPMFDDTIIACSRVHLGRPGAPVHPTRLGMGQRKRCPSGGANALSPAADKAKATPTQRPTVGTPVQGGNTDDGINYAYNLLIHDAMSAIKAHSVFSGVENAAPLKMANNAGGSQAPYCSTDYQHAMNGAGHYVCGGNFWWQDPLYTPCPGVPMNVTRVEKMSGHLFLEPAPFPVIMTIGMGTSHMPDQHFGALPRCTPEEFVHAFILAVHRDIKLGANDEVLHAWRRMMLSIPYRFETHASRERIFFRAFALREELVTAHAVVARTAFQRIYEIARFKTMAEQDMGRPLSASDVASVYRARASTCGGETFSPGFVDNALTVFDRALKLPEVRNMITQMEDLHGSASPFNSITKLYAIVKRAKPPTSTMSPDEALLWLFGWVTDLVLSGAFTPEDLTVRVLSGEQAKPSNPGILALAMLKLGVLRHMVEVMMPAANVPADCSRLIESKMSNNVEYRKNYASFSVDQEVDSAWQGTLPESGRMVLAIIEAGRGTYQRQIVPKTCGMFIVCTCCLFSGVRLRSE